MNIDNISDSDTLYSNIQELLKIYYKIKMMNNHVFKVWSKHVYNCVLDIIIYFENNQPIYLLKKININNGKENTLEFYNNIKYYVTNEEIIYMAKLLNISIYDNTSVINIFDRIETLYIESLLNSNIKPITKPNKPIIEPNIKPITEPNIKPIIEPNIDPIKPEKEFILVSYKKNKKNK